jgi:hypothetical protein
MGMLKILKKRKYSVVFGICPNPFRKNFINCVPVEENRIMEKLQWTKDIFGSKLELRQGTEQIGKIQWENMVSSKAQAMINGKLFILNREFFLSKLEIYDANDQSLLGMVMVNIFNPRSDVVLNGKRFELEIQNFWQSRWSWKYNGSEIINFTSNEFITKDKGEIELLTSCNEEVEILILLGLFVRNQFILFMLLLLFLVVVVIL